jgi:hypothetical protein
MYTDKRTAQKIDWPTMNAKGREERLCHPISAITRDVGDAGDYEREPLFSTTGIEFGLAISSSGFA